MRSYISSSIFSKPNDHSSTSFGAYTNVQIYIPVRIQLIPRSRLARTLSTHCRSVAAALPATAMLAMSLSGVGKSRLNSITVAPRSAALSGKLAAGYTTAAPKVSVFVQRLYLGASKASKLST